MRGKEAAPGLPLCVCGFASLEEAERPYSAKPAAFKGMTLALTMGRDSMIYRRSSSLSRRSLCYVRVE
jgi:hypothetical protein